MSSSTLAHPGIGDEIAIAGPGHSSSSPNLHGEILDVLGEPGSELYRVRWSDGTITILPSGAAPKQALVTRATPRTRIRVLGSRGNAGTAGLVDGWIGLGLPVELVGADDLLDGARPDDLVLGRLDVLPTLDGVEPGLLALLLAERRGLRVLNPAHGLLGAHDKLRTARLFAQAHLPHPATVVVPPGSSKLDVETPCVVKPRFGSWGRDVCRCENDRSLAGCLEEMRERPWFRRHGALVQELLPTGRRDLRVIVAGGRVVGAAERVAAEGEWRTNVTLGGSLRRAWPSDDAAELARTAAAVVDADLVGVDLVPTAGRGYVVLELNAAVDFDETYALGDASVFLEIARALNLAG